MENPAPMDFAPLLSKPIRVVAFCAATSSAFAFCRVALAAFISSTEPFSIATANCKTAAFLRSVAAAAADCATSTLWLAVEYLYNAKIAALGRIKYWAVFATAFQFLINSVNKLMAVFIPLLTVSHRRSTCLEFVA